MDETENIDDFTFCQEPKGFPDVSSMSIKDKKKSSGTIWGGSIADLEKQEKVGSLAFKVIDASSQKASTKQAGSNVGSSQGIKSGVKKPVSRAKVPFQIGYSHMDWLKLTRTHPDLAGKGCTLMDQVLRPRELKMTKRKLNKGEVAVSDRFHHNFLYCTATSPELGETNKEESPSDASSGGDEEEPIVVHSSPENVSHEAADEPEAEQVVNSGGSEPRVEAFDVQTQGVENPKKRHGLDLSVFMKRARVGTEGGSSKKVEKVWEGPQVKAQVSKGTMFGSISTPVGSLKTQGKTVAAKAKSPLRNVEKKTAPGADSLVRVGSPVRVPSPVRVQSPVWVQSSIVGGVTGLDNLGSRPVSPPPVQMSAGGSSSLKAPVYTPSWSITEDTTFSDLRACCQFVDCAVPPGERAIVEKLPLEEQIPRLAKDFCKYFSIGSWAIKELSKLKHERQSYDKNLNDAKEAEKQTVEAIRKEFEEERACAVADKKKLEAQVQDMAASLNFAQQELALEKPKVEALAGKLKAEAEKNVRLEKEMATLKAQAEQSARLKEELAAVKAEAEKSARLAEELAAAQAEAEKGARLEKELAAARGEVAALAKEKAALEEQLDVQKRVITRQRASLTDAEAQLQKDRKWFMMECMPKVVTSCLKSPQLVQAVENLNLAARQAGIADTLKGKMQRSKVNFALERADTVLKQRQDEFNNLVFPPLTVLSALADEPNGFADLKAVLAEVEE